MPLELIRSVAGSVALLIGVIFCVLGVYGLIRFPDTYTRLHGMGQTLTIGAGGVLTAVLLLESERAGLKAIATALFLLFTSPVVTHALARASYRTLVPLGDAAIADDLAADRATGTFSAGRPSPIRRFFVHEERY